jgi:hypothetical protein
MLVHITILSVQEDDSKLKEDFMNGDDFNNFQ